LLAKAPRKGGSFTEYDHVVEAVPSQNLAAGKT
jgi:hypothetical protein